jgi:hypothetical protein
MDIIFKYLLNILSTTIGIVLAYFIVRAIAKEKKPFINKFFKGVAILFFVAVTITILSNIFLLDEPDPLEPAIEYVKTDPKIKNLIGDYKGYAYNKHTIPEESQQYGMYNFTVLGNLADLSMDCYVSKNSKGDWYIVKISNQQLLDKKEE